MEDLRYGFYLRPSPAMCRAQAEVHALLERQYALRAAGRFMPHATVKGFFRSAAGAGELEAACGRAVEGHRALTITARGPVAFGRSGIALRVQHDEAGAPNAALQALHEAALRELLPLVREDCDFTPREWLGPRFDAHLTLAMADIPARLFDEVLAFVRELAPIGPPAFRADTMQLFAFASDDWAGPWWETLRWRHIASWRLP